MLSQKSGFVSLKWKLFILMALAFTIVAIGISWATYVFQERQLQRERVFHLERNSRELTAQVARTQESLIKRLEYINYGVLQSKTTISLSDYVNDINLQAPSLMLISGMQTITVMDINGGMLYSNEWFQDQVISELSKRAITEEQPVVATHCRTTCFVYAAIPVLTQNETVSLAASTPLSDVINETHQASGWNVGIYLPNGDAGEKHWSSQVVALSNHALLMPRLKAVPNIELPELNEHLIFSADGAVYELVRLPIDLSGQTEGDWLLVSDVTSSYNAIKNNTLQLLAVTWCTLLFCALWLARLAQPSLLGLGVFPQVMAALSKHRYEEARGFLQSQHATFERKYPDELSVLAQSTEDMVQELERLDSEMEDRNHNLQVSNLELAKQRDFVAGLLDNAQAVIVLQDASGVCQSINKFGRLILGKTENQCIGSPFEALFGYMDKSSKQSLLHVSSGRRNLYRHETQLDGSEGSKISISWLHSTLHQKNEENAILSIGLDISEQKEVQHQLHWLAIHDPLTELLNRSGLQRRLQSTIRLCKDAGTQVALMFCDIDHFKRVNDAYGHPSGDQLLAMVADNLSSYLPAGDILARWGGDEFVIAFETSGGMADIKRKAESILQQINGVYLIEEREVFVSTSVGVSLYPDHGVDATTLIKNADVALFQAKRDGRKQIIFYNPEQNTAYEEQISLDTDLRYGIARNEFYLNFQPQVCALTQRVIGAEALIRWQHPVHGFISPDRFIPLAEDNGQIIEIGQWVLEEACLKLNEWKSLIDDDFKLSVNLAGPQIMDPDFLDRVKAVVNRTGVSTAQLEFEITETFIMTHRESTVAKLAELRALGITLSIDDFGTGYSSLSYIKSLPIDKLKIDKSFVFDIGKSNDDEEIAKAIIALGHSLDLSIIAEGVETQQQADFLAAEKCDYFQGYFFSRPLAADDCRSYLVEQAEIAKLKAKTPPATI